MNFAVIDIGSPSASNLGWAIVGPNAARGGTSQPDERTLEPMLHALTTASLADPLVLGFEAPMFVPVGRPAGKLLKARVGEDRAWSASAGATVATAALEIVPWVLQELNKRSGGVRAWQYPFDLPAGSREVLLFEAFVSGGSSDKKDPDRHARDAEHAAAEVRSRFEKEGLPRSDVHCDGQCFSLLGAAIMRAGLGHDPSVLAQECLVVKLRKPCP